MEIKDQLKLYREKEDISQEDMAKQIGCSYFSYIRWEKGKPISRAWLTILKEKGIIK